LSEDDESNTGAIDGAAAFDGVNTPNYSHDTRLF
jgi:hypothetical protein